MLFPGFRAGAALALASALAACSPTLDWREVRPEGAGLLALFPCKPSKDARRVALAGVPLRIGLQACQAGGATFALSFADTGDPARVAATLEALRAAAGINLSGTPVVVGPAQVPGMTPQALAQRVALQGRLPDGSAVRQELLFFVKGTVIYQATVLGPHVDPAAIDAFFEGLKLGA
jgi:hypothetical protein